MNKKFIFSAFFAMAMFLSAFAAQTSAQTLVINEVYGGGGNAGPPAAVYNADFIELYCVGPAACDLTGLYLQYASAAGTFNTSGQIALPAVTVAAGDFYLIQTTAAGATGAPLPTPDLVVPAANAVNMSGSPTSGGNVILVNGALANNTTCASVTTFIDKVGYGTGACSETAAAPAVSNTTSAQRIPNGTDTNNNSANFQSATPTPDAANVGPTAADATIEGRVLSNRKRGVPDVLVTLTDSSGAMRTTLTNRTGGFRFDNVETGQTYILSVKSRRYQFSEPTRIITVNESLDGIYFTAY